MIRKLEFQCGIVWGDDMRTVVGIIPSIEKEFTSRKWFDEYYVTSWLLIDFDIEMVDKLSNEFSLKIWYDTITVLN